MKTLDWNDVLVNKWCTVVIMSNERESMSQWGEWESDERMSASGSQLWSVCRRHCSEWVLTQNLNRISQQNLATLCVHCTDSTAVTHRRECSSLTPHVDIYIYIYIYIYWWEWSAVSCVTDTEQDSQWL